jgi:hypothetical protein
MAPEAFRYLPAEQRARLVRTTLGPSGAWWLRERVVGRVPVHCAQVLRGCERVGGGRVRLRVEGSAGVQVLEVDHVLAGTGYRVDLSRLGYLPAPMRAQLRTYRGFPQLTPDFESTVPGLYFVGLAAAHTFGPLQRFVHGARLAAERVSAAVERPLPQRAPLAPRESAPAPRLRWTDAL